MIKKNKAFVYIFLILFSVSVCGNNICEAAYDKGMHSISYAILDADTGRVLLEKNADSKRAMASTTKIMTLIIALENGNEEDIAKVSSYAKSMPKVRLGVKTDECYRLGDLYYSLMLESHNDTAVIIAETIAGDTESFARLMNEKAALLGLKDTYFITPNGLDAEDLQGTHSTTARELALLMRYCTFISEKKDRFVEICSTREYSFCDMTGNVRHTVNNKNALLDMLDGVIAGKTGFTSKAGYCYVCAYEKNDKRYVLSLLGCGWPPNKTYKWQDAKNLIYYIDDNYRRQYFFINRELFINVKNAAYKNKIKLYFDKQLSLLLGDDEKVTYMYKVRDNIEAPVKRGTVVGQLYIYIDDKLFEKRDIYTAQAAKRFDYSFCLETVIDCLLTY